MQAPREPGFTTSAGMATEKIDALIGEIEKVIKGKRNQVELMITCLLAKGHVLIEDNPGSGKTVTARSLAAAITGSDTSQATFHRIQFTPDLLPMDLIGTHIYDEVNKDFIFKKGPLFSNILLADEINRASPKVQSALLECMAEGQISVGDTTYKLDELFFVIATQNPIETEGTYPLPAAQLDRFFMKIYFGYVDESVELDIYHQYNRIADNLVTLQQVIGYHELTGLQQYSNTVTVHEEIVRSVAHIVRATRTDANIEVGASTRAGIAFLRCLRAYAVVRGRNYVTEDDVQDIAYSVLHHRLVYKNTLGRNESLQRIITAEINRLSGLRIH